MKNKKNMLQRLSLGMFCAALVGTVCPSYGMDSEPAKNVKISNTAAIENSTSIMPGISSTISSPTGISQIDRKISSNKVASLMDCCLAKLAQIATTPNPNSFAPSLTETIKEEYRMEQLKVSNALQNSVRVVLHALQKPKRELKPFHVCDAATKQLPHTTTFTLPELTQEEIQGVLNENITELPICDLLNLVIPVVEKCNLTDK